MAREVGSSASSRWGVPCSFSNRRIVACSLEEANGDSRQTVRIPPRLPAKPLPHRGGGAQPRSRLDNPTLQHLTSSVRVSECVLSSMVSGSPESGRESVAVSRASSPNGHRAGLRWQKRWSSSATPGGSEPRSCCGRRPQHQGGGRRVVGPRLEWFRPRTRASCRRLTVRPPTWCPGPGSGRTVLVIYDTLPWVAPRGFLALLVRWRFGWRYRDAARRADRDPSPPQATAQDVASRPRRPVGADPSDLPRPRARVPPLPSTPPQSSRHVDMSA